MSPVNKRNVQLKLWNDPHEFYPCNAVKKKNKNRFLFPNVYSFNTFDLIVDVVSPCDLKQTHTPYLYALVGEPIKLKCQVNFNLILSDLTLYAPKCSLTEYNEGFGQWETLPNVKIGATNSAD